MKNLTKSLLIALISCVCLSSCIYAKSGIKPSKDRIERNVAVKNFSKVSSNGNFSVVYEQAEKVEAVLQCPSNLEQYVEIVNNGEELVIRYKKDVRIDYSGLNWDENCIRVKLKSPDIDKITLNGSGDFRAVGDVAAEKLSVALNGSGDIILNGVRCNKATSPGDFAAQLNGSGDLNVRGEVLANNAALQLNGSGDLNIYKVVAHSLAAQLNGSGDLGLNTAVAEKSGFVLNGSGDLNMKNIQSTNIDSKLMGSGDLGLGNIVADAVNGTIQGSGDMTFRGTCQTAIFNSESSSDINASGLVAQYVEANAGGSSEITCFAQKELKASIGGSASISYRGDAQVNCTTKEKPSRM